MDNTCGLRIPQHHRLENHWTEINSQIDQLEEALDQIKDTLERLDGTKPPEALEAAEEAGTDARDDDDEMGGGRRRPRAARRGGFVNQQKTSSSAELAFAEAAEERRRALRRHKYAMWWSWLSGKTKARRDRRQELSARASLPYDIQMTVLRREAMVESFTGKTLKIGSWRIKVFCMFQPLVKWFKLFCFENFGGFEDVSAGTQKPIATMLKKSKRCTMLGSAYLIFVTFFIFLTAVRMNDNKTIMFVMLTTFVSEATFIAMVHPIEAFITAGFLPAIAASFFFSDVTRHMRQEHDQANTVRRLDAQERVIDPNGRFEVSPEWMRIENEEAFSGASSAGPANGESGGGPKVLSGGGSRVRGVVVNGQMVSRNKTAWDLSHELHENGISSVRELKDHTVVSKEWLANIIRLNDQQIEAFWRAVHEPLVEDGEQRGRLHAILSNLFGKKTQAGASSAEPRLTGRKLRAGSIPQAPESPICTERKMSIFPVMAGAKGRAGGSISDEGDSSEDEQKSEEPEDQVLSAARKFKGLRIKAKAGNNNAMGASASPTPHGVTDLRSPTHRKDEEERAPEHVAAGDVEEQAVHDEIPPREGSSPDVAATDAPDGVLQV
jgi:hypothetical protein